MRYYTIQLGGPGGGGSSAVPTTAMAGSSAASSTSTSYTSHAGGQTNPAALNIELDVFAVPYATPSGNSIVRIWGVSLQDISQAKNLNNKSISVYAGMQKGLPLANPSQSGLIVQGTVLQAFGNWIGTNQTLDLIIIAGNAPTATPPNININWKKGTKLSDAISTTLRTAFPGFTSTVNVNANLVLQTDQIGYYNSLIEFGQFIKNISAPIIGGTYQGVDILLKEKSFNVFDGSTQSSPKKINFQDLVGQPTWIDSPLIQFKCVMRADISVNDYVTLPPTITTNTAQSFSQYRDNSVFQGTFRVQKVRHVGNFRQPDAESWVTTFDAYPATASA